MYVPQPHLRRPVATNFGVLLSASCILWCEACLRKTVSLTYSAVSTVHGGC